MSHSTAAALEKEHRIFEQYSVPRALAVMILPTILSQMIHVVYNLADTWFVGLTENPAAVAAVSLCLPTYNILTCISNMFGIGGAAVIARMLGSGQSDRVKKAFSVAFWGAVTLAGIYSAVMLICGRSLLMLIGGDETSIGYAYSYAMTVIVIGGIPTVLAAVLSHLIRATGESAVAGIGLTLGGVLNIALDPLFMFVILPPGREVLGAALATLLSNLISLAYFAIFLLRRRDNELFCVHPAQLDHSAALLGEVIRCGGPSFLMSAMPNLSNSILNSLTRGIGGAQAVAGLGIVRKIDSLAFSVNQGVTQGMLPLVAYCYASKKHDRMKSTIALAAVCTVTFSILCSTLSFIFSRELLTLFIRDAATIEYGSRFLRILCFAIPFYSLTYVMIASFQATGRYLQPFLLSFRRGFLDTVLFFVIRAAFGVQYIFWSSPIAEATAFIIGGLLFANLMKKIKKQEEQNVYDHTA